MSTGTTCSRICGRRVSTGTRSPRPNLPVSSTVSTRSALLGGDATVNDVISAIPVGSGDAGSGYDFGELPPATLSGSVFEDLNNDGVQDPGELGVAGVDVTLTGTDDLGNPVDITVQTDVDGNYAVP